MLLYASSLINFSVSHRPQLDWWTWNTAGYSASWPHGWSQPRFNLRRAPNERWKQKLDNCPNAWKQLRNFQNHGLQTDDHCRILFSVSIFSVWVHWLPVVHPHQFLGTSLLLFITSLCSLVFKQKRSFKCEMPSGLSSTGLSTAFLLCKRLQIMQFDNALQVS